MLLLLLSRVERNKLRNLLEYFSPADIKASRSLRRQNPFFLETLYKELGLCLIKDLDSSLFLDVVLSSCSHDDDGRQTKQQ